MTLRSDLLATMEKVAEANPRSPYDVATAGVAAFDFISARGRSLVAALDTMERLHRQLYLEGAERDAFRDAMKAEGVPENVREAIMAKLNQRAPEGPQNAK